MRTITVPIRTYNEANGSHGHWRKKNARRKAVREAVTYALIGESWEGVPKPSVEAPWSVLLVRLGPGVMDDDGVVSSLKSARDAVAAFVGVDDKRRDIVRYAYDQRKSREFGVEIEITWKGASNGPE